MSTRPINWPARRTALLAAADQSMAAGGSPRVVCRQLTRLMDRWVLQNLSQKISCGILAVGSYGRAELFPHSDLDVWVIADAPDAEVSAMVTALLAPWWDAGLRVGHRVIARTDIATVCADLDVQTQTNIFDARWIAGPLDWQDAWQAARWRVLQDRAWVTAWYHGKTAELATRQQSHDTTVYLREPQLKDGMGGLRDYQWTHHAQRLQYWVRGDEKKYSPTSPVQSAFATIARFRWALHRQSATPTERLTLDAQAALPADLSLAHYYAAADAMVRARERAWRQLQQVLQIESPAKPRPLLPRCWSPIADVATAVRDLRDGHRESTQFPELAVIRGLVEREAHHRYTVDEHLVRTLESLGALQSGRGEWPAPVTEAVAQIQDWRGLGLATLYHDVGKGRAPTPHATAGAELVQKAAVRFGWPESVQRDAAWLVQQHQLFPHVAFRRDLEDPQLIEQIAELVETPERAAALFLLGIADLSAVGPRLYTPWKGELIATLYRRVVRVLTQDPRAPVVERTTLVEQGVVRGLERAPLTAWLEQMPTRYLRDATSDAVVEHFTMHAAVRQSATWQWQVHPRRGAQWRVTVVATDQPGRFAQCCIALALHRVQIQEVRAYAAPDHIIVDRFDCVVPRGWHASDWQRVEQTWEQLMSGRLSIDAGLARLRSRPTASTTPLRLPVIDNAISENATVIEIVTADRLGLLAELSACFFAQHCNLMYAKVLTLGQQAHDTFYVQDAAGGKITDPERVAILKRALQVIAR